MKKYAIYNKSLEIRIFFSTFARFFGNLRNIPKYIQSR